MEKHTFLFWLGSDSRSCVPWHRASCTKGRIACSAKSRRGLEYKSSTLFLICFVYALMVMRSFNMWV
jgi:hypothetical protein